MTLTFHAKNCVLLSQCEGIGNLNPIPLPVTHCRICLEGYIFWKPI